MAHALTAAVSAPSRRWPQRPEIVSRERLVQRLAQARDVPLALLIAPAGYGKTTLLEDWAAHDGRPFAWVTLSSESNDPAGLLSSIARALDAVEPLEPAARETLGGLTDALGRTATPLVLALDEADALHTRAAREVVLALAAAMPAGSALALASRTDFALPLGRLRAQRRPIELRADDLALTTSEANALLRLAGLELGSERLLTLMRRTGGWPAGLYLAALSLREQGGDAVEEFSGADRFVADYVREEILDRLPADQQRFLARTSVLDRLSAPSCDAVLDRGDSAALLARLARSNVPMTALDRSETAYRYQPLLADALRAELRRREPGQPAVLHARASAWCAEHGEADAAIGHAIDAEDLPRAARLMWENVVPYAATRRADRLWSRLDRLGADELARNPLLALVAAGCSLTAGDGYEARRWTSVARGGPGEAEPIEAGLAVMDAGIAREGVARMAADALRAHELLAPGSPWRPLCMFFEGSALHLTANRGEAALRLEDGAHRAAAAAPSIQALCLAQLALLALDDGEPGRAANLAARARAQVDRCGLDGCPAMALVVAVSAALTAERGDPGRAKDDFELSLGLLAQLTEPSPWYELECRAALARAALCLARPGLARELVAEAAPALRRTPDAPVLAEWLDTLRLQVELAPGQSASADWSLTSAELRVLRHLPSHLSCREIADCLYVSPNTVKTHVRGIYRKLGVSSRGHAVECARGAGLVDGSPG